METPEFASTLRLPEIRFGAGRSSELAEVVRGFGRRALVFTRGRDFTDGEDWARLSDGLWGLEVDFALEAVSGEPSPGLVDEIVARVGRAGPSTSSSGSVAAASWTRPKLSRGCWSRASR